MCEITGRLHKVEQEEALIAELMALLNDTTRWVILLYRVLGSNRFKLDIHFS